MNPLTKNKDGTVTWDSLPGDRYLATGVLRNGKRFRGIAGTYQKFEISTYGVEPNGWYEKVNDTNYRVSTTDTPQGEGWVPTHRLEA